MGSPGVSAWLKMRQTLGVSSPTQTEIVLRVALERGYLSSDQIDSAVSQSGASGEGVLQVLRPLLNPEQIAELTRIFRSPPPAAPAKPADGRKRVGPYLIERELARGGMGVVSVAVHAELGRRVALKQLLKAGMAKDHERTRFLREAQALAKLTHKNVVRIYEVGEDDEGQLFLAMDLVDGESLDRLLERDGAMDSKRAVELMVQVARAMDAAHRKGILHRDLKPANVILASDGSPRITDFGLARDAEEESERLTQTGEMLGTPAYMPPEQASGEKDRVDARADIYSLGATLFALLTGEAPFKGETPINIVTKVLSKPPPRASSIREALDPDLDTLILKCLEKDPADRFRSAGVFADELERVLAGEPIRTRPPSLGQQFAKWRRRKRGLFIALTVGVLLVTLTGVGGLWAVWETFFNDDGSRAAADREKPVVRLDLPLPATLYPSATITGTVSKAGCSVSLGDEWVELEGQRFSLVLDTTKAHLRIRVSAKDAQSRSGEATVPLIVLDPGSHGSTKIEKLPAKGGGTVIFLPGVHRTEFFVDRPMTFLGVERDGEKSVLVSAGSVAPSVTVALSGRDGTADVGSAAVVLRGLRFVGNTAPFESEALKKAGDDKDGRGRGQLTYAKWSGLLNAMSRAPSLRVDSGVAVLESSVVVGGRLAPAVMVGHTNARLVAKDSVFQRGDPPSILVGDSGTAHLERVHFTRIESDEAFDSASRWVGRELEGDRPGGSPKADSDERMGTVHVVENASVFLSGCSIRGVLGQGIALHHQARAELEDCVLSRCLQEAVLLDKASHMGISRGSVFSENSDNAILVQDTAWLSIKNTEFVRNGVRKGMGDPLSGVHFRRKRKDLAEAPESVIQNCVFDGNGHGVYAESAKVLLKACKLKNSTDCGVIVKDGSTLKLLNCEVTNNRYGLEFIHTGSTIDLVGSPVSKSKKENVHYRGRGSSSNNTLNRDAGSTITE